MIQSARGRFEVAAVDSSVAHAIATSAEDAWRLLSGPLGLPDAFPTPVYFRVVPTAPGTAAEGPPFHVTVEIGGTVSVRLRSEVATQSVAVRRALVRGLLTRLAVARHGFHERQTVPWWLEHGCVGWWQTRFDAAQLDALKQEAAHQTPPAVDVLLRWPRDFEEPRDMITASTWLLTYLQADSGPAREWPTFLLRLLAGEDPVEALVASYPGRFSTAEERELWWATGFHHVRRVRSLPSLEAADSQHQLGALARFVFADLSGDSDAVVPLRQVIARTKEPVVAAELARRATYLAKLVPALHPFYRNAGLSLAEILAGRKISATRSDALCAIFEEDWRAATELEVETSAALDRLEARMRAP
jgi:hypothetical protein